MCENRDYRIVFRRLEQLLVHKPDLSASIVEAIGAGDPFASHETQPSTRRHTTETTMAAVENQLRLRGWSPKRSTFFVAYDDVPNLRLSALSSPAQRQVIAKTVIQAHRR